MALTFAGIDLLLPDEDSDLAEFLRLHLDLNRMLRQLAPATNARAVDVSPMVPIVRYPEQPGVEINRLWWPTGASRWGTFYAIVDGKRAEEIEKICWGENKDANTPQTLEMHWNDPLENDGNGLAVEEGQHEFHCEMFLLQSIPLSGYAIGENTTNESYRSLYLLALVDPRYYWQGKMTGKMEYIDSWTELFDSLAGALQLSPSNTSAPFTYATAGTPNTAFGAPSPLLSQSFRPAAPLLDAALESVGYRLVAHPAFWSAYTGRERYGYDSAFPPNPFYELSECLPVAGWYGRWGDAALPDRIQIAFRSQSQANEWYTETRTCEQSIPGTKGTTSQRLTIRSTMPMIGDISSPDNSTNLVQLADEIAKSIYTAANLRYDVTVAGLADSFIHPSNDAVEIRWGSQVDGVYQAQTRAWSMPLMFYFQQVQYSAMPVDSSSSGSGGGGTCVSTIDGVPFSEMLGYQAGVWQAVYKTPEDCVYLVTPNQCDSSSSLSSGSSSSGSGDSSSSSSETPEGCVFCEGVDLSEVTYSISAPSFVGPTPPGDCFGDTPNLELTYAGVCSWQVIQPKCISDQGTQRWVLSVSGPGSFRVSCYDHGTGELIAEWELEGGSECCGSGTYGRTFNAGGTAPLSIFVTAAGGPC